MEAKSIRDLIALAGDRYGIGKSRFYIWRDELAAKGFSLKPIQEGDRVRFSDRQLAVMNALRAHLDAGGTLASFEIPAAEEEAGKLAQRQPSQLDQTGLDQAVAVEEEEAEAEAEAVEKIYQGACRLAAGMAIAQLRLAAELEESDLPLDLQAKVAEERRKLCPKQQEPVEAIAGRFLRAWMPAIAKHRGLEPG